MCLIAYVAKIFFFVCSVGGSVGALLAAGCAAVSEARSSRRMAAQRGGEPAAGIVGLRISGGQHRAERESVRLHGCLLPVGSVISRYGRLPP